MMQPLGALIHAHSCPQWRAEDKPCDCPPGYPQWVGVDKDGYPVFGARRVKAMLERVER